MEQPQEFLMADMGGTNIRFALCRQGKITQPRHYKCADFSSLSAAVRFYLTDEGCLLPKAFMLGVPGPVLGDNLTFVNNPWSFSISALKKEFDFKILKVVNDFAASSMAVPYLTAKDLVSVGSGEVYSDHPKVVIGPGTGLGVGIVVPVQGTWQPIETEGGHVTLAARTTAEFDLILKAQKLLGHVSAESFLAGKGLALLYHLVGGEKSLLPEEVMQRAMKKEPTALNALNFYFSFLGNVAGNLALSLGAFGGVYISGGIIRQPGVLELFLASDFRTAFEDKGARASYLKRIPIFAVITHDTAFLGLKHLMLSSL